MSNTVPLATDAPIRLIEATGLSSELRAAVPADDAPKVPSYGSVKTAMYSGKIPFEKIGGRLVVRSTDLPEIARAFGLTVAA